jgi:hypothetical protein
MDFQTPTMIPFTEIKFCLTRNMKPAIFTTSLLLAICLSNLANISAQPIDTTMLCRGSHFTEEEGRASLKQFASTYHDRAGWEKRASRIKQGFLRV